MWGVMEPVLGRLLLILFTQVECKGKGRDRVVWGSVTYCTRVRRKVKVELWYQETKTLVSFVQT